MLDRTTLNLGNIVYGLYCLGKVNGENIMSPLKKDISVGMVQMYYRRNPRVKFNEGPGTGDHCFEDDVVILWRLIWHQCGNIFEADECDAFDSDVDEGPTSTNHVMGKPSTSEDSNLTMKLGIHTDSYNPLHTRLIDACLCGKTTKNIVVQYNDLVRNDALMNLEHQIKEKDNVIRHLKDLVASVNDRSREPHNDVDVTALIEQNDCDRVELEKVKQHYKELYDSIDKPGTSLVTHQKPRAPESSMTIICASSTGGKDSLKQVVKELEAMQRKIELSDKENRSGNQKAKFVKTQRVGKLWEKLFADIGYQSRPQYIRGQSELGFGFDHLGAIMGYGDYVMGDSCGSQELYYVEISFKQPEGFEGQENPLTSYRLKTALLGYSRDPRGVNSMAVQYVPAQTFLQRTVEQFVPRLSDSSGHSEEYHTIFHALTASANVPAIITCNSSGRHLAITTNLYSVFGKNYVYPTLEGISILCSNGLVRGMKLAVTTQEPPGSANAVGESHPNYVDPCRANDGNECIWDQTFSLTKASHKAGLFSTFLSRPESVVHLSGDDYVLGFLNSFVLKKLSLWKHIEKREKEKVDMLDLGRAIKLSFDPVFLTRSWHCWRTVDSFHWIDCQRRKETTDQFILLGGSISLILHWTFFSTEDDTSEKVTKFKEKYFSSTVTSGEAFLYLDPEKAHEAQAGPDPEPMQEDQTGCRTLENYSVS
ncbi:hypothetical protein Tco_1058478 [Tanacetum coccineum]|uniref:Uncharacterized protein n=1 Tax=Tanacetum coccineum TaxID=301880 RepID=A0ABQ5H8G4_9ASTR